MMMADSPKIRIIKTELAAAARRGMEEFMRSTRGANMLGAKASIVLVDNQTLRIECQCEGKYKTLTMHIKGGEGHA